MIRVAAGVLLRSGKILIGRRSPGRGEAGKWEFPGGRIEEGESPEQALRRELSEELGIAAEIGPEAARSSLGAGPSEIELIAHLVPRFTGSPALRVHDRFEWVEARRLLDFDLAPADIPIARALAAHRRRSRYRGTHPRAFAEKYKELAGDPRAAAKALARGSTPAGAHVAVMLGEVLAALEPLEGASVLDCTLGWGGHSEELARRAGPRGSLLALDRDASELERAARRLRGLGLALEARHADFGSARELLRSWGRGPFDAVLADLGVSSMQLDRPERGMSFKADGPLDMRMDPSAGVTAAQWLERAKEADIRAALERLGEEPDAAAIAAALAGLRARGRSPKTTQELASAVTSAKGLGEGRWRKRGAFSTHPAARTFQAIRMAVNDERGALSRLLESLPFLVRPGGRAAILTFHSGEERLVKEALASQAAAGVWAAPLAPPARPTTAEVRLNPRARSARLWRALRAGISC